MGRLGNDDGVCDGDRQLRQDQRHTRGHTNRTAAVTTWEFMLNRVILVYKKRALSLTFISSPQTGVKDIHMAMTSYRDII